MRLFRFALAAAAVLVLVPAAQAQRRDEGGMVAMTTTTRHPVRVAYRAGIDVLLRGGYAISVMSLDRVLMTPDQREDGRPAQSVVQLLFERKGASTEVVATAVVPDAAGRDVCRTDRCMTTVLLIETMVTAKLDTALSRIKPAPQTAADRLAAAGALGYSPSRPIRVGGGRLEDGDRDQRRYLASLRGPRGERVSSPRRAESRERGCWTRTRSATPASRSPSRSTWTSTRRPPPGRACPPASPVPPPRRADRETVTAAATYGAT
jgi:hypothetical protein